MFATGGCSDCLYPQWLKHFNPKPAQSTLLAGAGKPFKDRECQQRTKQRRITTSLTTHVLSLWINDLYLESQTALVSALHNELLGTDSDLSPRPADPWTAFFFRCCSSNFKGNQAYFESESGQMAVGFLTRRNTFLWEASKEDHWHTYTNPSMEMKELPTKPFCVSEKLTWVSSP